MSDGVSTSSYRRVCGLAAGGMGLVELAVREEGRFRRLYAVKRLQEAYVEDTDFREMFLEEARIAGLIRHPNVVSVLDLGDDERGPFLVMDYIEGTSASRLIQRASERDEELPLQVCLRIAMEAAEGLHAAHELRDARGRPLDLVHRDVSPQNLLIGFDGITRVTDFGIAKAFGRTTRTATGVLKGKFGYVSPEQLRFEEPDRRSDLFSLGVVLFELVAGRRLYKNQEGMDGARRILTEPPPDLGDERDDVPAALVQLLFSMLAKDPAHRPADAQKVARALEEILAERIAEEGRVEVADFVREAFADERKAQEERVAGAIASATGVLRTGDAGEVSEETKTERVGSRRRRNAVIAIGAIAGVLVAAAGLFAMTQSGEPEADLAAPVSVARPAAHAERERPAVAAAVEPQTTPSAEPPVAAVPPAAPAPDEVASEETAPEKRRRARRRTVRRERGAEAATKPGGGVPMWGWQP